MNMDVMKGGGNSRGDEGREDEQSCVPRRRQQVFMFPQSASNSDTWEI